MLDERLLPAGWDVLGKTEKNRRRVLGPAMSARGLGTTDPTPCCSPHLKT